jgi:hypothetical protein
VKDYSVKLGGQMNTMVSRMNPESKKSFLNTIGPRLSELQNKLVGSLDPKMKDRLYLIQYLARHIAGNSSFETENTIYDELASVIWTAAPKGFDLLYEPFETPTFSSYNNQKKYTSLINGGYFNRVDNARYHA